MDNGEFTQKLEDNFWNFSFPDDDENFSTVLDYLNQANHFRTFSGGLTQFISEHGYNGDPMDVTSKTTFLLNKFADINYKISRQTVLGWFNDSHRPDPVEASRDKIFALCFSLNCSLEKVFWFFRNVYFDRSFNCRSKKEAVYYYCLNNKHTYSHALNLLQIITSLPPTQTTIDKDIIFTKYITNKIHQITTDDEFITYTQSNIKNFCDNNISAFRNITNLLQIIQGKPTDKDIIKAIEKSHNVNQLNSCGLVVQDYVKYKLKLKDPGDKNPNFASVDFMLNVIFSEKLSSQKDFSFAKDSALPSIIRMNFPTKKTMSDIITKKIKSYDAIRKMLILLKFYEFWFSINERDEEDCYSFDNYVYEMNDLLQDSGFDYLYIGNPYDWLFLYAAKMDNPLDYFRGIIASILNDEHS